MVRKIHPSLSNVNGHEAKVVVLLVFAWRYRVGGRRGARKEPVRSDTVASALLAVGKGIADLGQQDPRFEIFGTNRYHPVLAAFLKKCKDDDAPGTKSYPATVDMLEALPKVLDTEHPIDGQLNTNVIDLCVAGFYWLMRPAEYCGFSTRNDDQSRSARTEAFRLRDTDSNSAARNN